MPEIASVPKAVRKQLNALLEELDQRAKLSKNLNDYYEGTPPIPEAIVRAKVTRAYRNLMPMSAAPWGGLIVDATQDRLEIAGIRSDDKVVDEAVWRLWQENHMDSESKIGQRETLIDGRSFALVWREPGSKIPTVTLDNSSTMAVMYREGSRHNRVAAVRRWVDEDDRTCVTLYGPDYLWKFVKADSRSQGQGGGRVKAGGVWWERREDDHEWPLKNPYGVVPVVEIAINRRLVPGCFPKARGEYTHARGLIDRIHLLTFLGLVVAFWMGFPLRGVIGEKILRDDDNNIIPPFDAYADGVAQLEDPQAKTFQYDAADRRNLFIYPELDQLSAITKTPRHYFPLENGMSNLAAEAIHATEGSQAAKVTNYKAETGEGDEDVLRLLGLMSDDRVILPQRAEVLWKDHESRTMAERADAATKIASIGLPVPTVAERYLNFTQQEVSRLEAQMMLNPLSALTVEALKAKAAEPEEAAAA